MQTCRLKVKCRLGVKCRKNHIRAKIRQMSSRKQNGSRFLFSPEPRDSVTQRYPCSAERGTRLTRPDEEHTWEACYVYTIYSTNSADFGHSAWKIQTWRTTSCRYVWSEPCVLLIYCCSMRCTFSRSFNEHPNSSSLHTLICNTFDRRSSKFPAEHLSLLLEWFTPFLSPLFLL